MPYISHDFINRVLDITNYSSFDVKREAVFFIATTCQASIPDLVTNEIIELLIEMLGCEVSYIVIRCVDTLFKIVTYILNNKSRNLDIITCLTNSDLNDRLDELMEQNNTEITERVSYLIHQIQQLS